MPDEDAHKRFHLDLEKRYLQCLKKIQELPKGVVEDRGYYVEQLEKIFGKGGVGEGFEEWLYEGLNGAMENCVVWYAMQLYSPFKYRSRLLHLSCYGKEDNYCQRIENWYYRQLEKGDQGRVIGLYHIAFDLPRDQESLSSWIPKSFTIRFKNKNQQVYSDGTFNVPRYSELDSLHRELLPEGANINACFDRHRVSYLEQLPPSFPSYTKNSLAAFFSKPELKTVDTNRLIGLLLFLQVLSPAAECLYYRTAIVRNGTVGLPLLVATSRELPFFEILSLQRTIDFISNAIISFDVESFAESEATELESTQWAHVMNARLDLLSGLTRVAVDRFSAKVGSTLLEGVRKIEDISKTYIAKPNIRNEISSTANSVRSVIEKASVRNLELLASEMDQMRWYNYGLQELGALNASKINEDYSFPPREEINFLTETFVSAAKHAICRMLLNEEAVYHGARAMLIKGSYLEEIRPAGIDESQRILYVINPAYHDEVFFREQPPSGCPKSILNIKEYRDIWHFVKHYFQEDVFQLPKPEAIGDVIQSVFFPKKEYSYIYIAVIEEMFYNAMKAIGNKVREACLRGLLHDYRIRIDFVLPFDRPDIVIVEMRNTIVESSDTLEEIWNKSRQGLKIVNEKVIYKVMPDWKKDDFVKVNDKEVLFKIPVKIKL